MVSQGYQALIDSPLRMHITTNHVRHEQEEQPKEHRPSNDLSILRSGQ